MALFEALTRNKRNSKNKIEVEEKRRKNVGIRHNVYVIDFLEFLARLKVSRARNLQDRFKFLGPGFDKNRHSYLPILFIQRTRGI